MRMSGLVVVGAATFVTGRTLRASRADPIVPPTPVGYGQNYRHRRHRTGVCQEARGLRGEYRWQAAEGRGSLRWPNDLAKQAAKMPALFHTDLATGLCWWTPTIAVMRADSTVSAQ